jgi:predicted dehydrogenase
MKVGIIGASFAKAAYLPALRHIDGVEVVAIASARIERARAAAEAFGVPQAYDDWQHMLEEHAFDLVCIATPTVTHAPMTVAALDAGAHVLCEKPTAMNAQEAKSMLERAEALGRVHMIDHELRFNPNRMRIKELIGSGEIGEVRHANILSIGSGWADPEARPRGDWWSLADQGGGRLGAMGSHQVDLVRWWFGEIRAVSGQALTLAPERRDKATGASWLASADDLTHFALEMTSGPLVQVLITGLAHHGLDNVTQIFGSKGTIWLSNNDEKLLFARAGEPLRDMSVADPNASLEGVGSGIWNVSVVGLMRELVAAIRQQRKPAGATFEDGWRNQLVLDAVRRSDAERRWIELAD